MPVNRCGFPGHKQVLLLTVIVKSVTEQFVFANTLSASYVHRELVKVFLILKDWTECCFIYDSWPLTKISVRSPPPGHKKHHCFPLFIAIFPRPVRSMLSTSCVRRAMKRAPTSCAGAALTTSTSSSLWSAVR